MSVLIKFYDSKKRHIGSNRGEIKDGKVTAAAPVKARYVSSEIDGHALHPIPTFDPLRVEYER